MLNLFPTMFLALLAYATLRVCVGGTLLYYGHRHLLRERESLMNAWRSLPLVGKHAVFAFGAVELLAGGMFVAGFLTQAAALTTLVFSATMLIFKKQLSHTSIPHPIYYVMLLAASASLFITGAGVFAFDLPI